jgi:hypothetical protein
MTATPKVTSAGQKELDKVEKQFEAFDNQVKSLTLDRMNHAPKLEVEEQTKLSQKQISESKDVYIKPFKTIGCKDKFNEKFRSEWDFAKEYVYITAENNEVIGETLDFWTKPFAGIPAEEWKVPCNTPVWVPRYVAERIKGCSYHVLSMNESKIVGNGGEGTYYGQMVVDNIKQRLDAKPATKNRSIFMGASNFA